MWLAISSWEGSYEVSDAGQVRSLDRRLLKSCNHSEPGIRTDNSLENLRWGTRSENALDRHAHGTMNQAKGEEQAHAKLTEDLVRWLRSADGRSLSSRAAARVLGVSKTTVLEARSRNSWKCVK